VGGGGDGEDAVAGMEATTCLIAVLTFANACSTLVKNLVKVVANVGMVLLLTSLQFFFC